MKICSKCNEENNDENSYCFNCGKELQSTIDIVNSQNMKKCSNCDEENNEDYNFCIKCGKKLHSNTNTDNIQQESVQQQNNEIKSIKTKIGYFLGLIIFVLIFSKGIWDWIWPFFFKAYYSTMPNPLITFILVVGGFYGSLYFFGELINMKESTKAILCLIGWSIIFVKGVLDLIWEMFFWYPFDEIMHNPFMTMILIIGGFMASGFYLNILNDIFADENNDKK